MLRQATPNDADAIADVLTAARAEHEWLPPIYTAESDRRFVRELLLPSHEIWVEEEEGAVVGFAALKDGLLGHIFVHPSAQGGGVGTRLLDKAKKLRPGGFELWTFQQNERARRFYERRGLVAVELTDGATNMEKIPDVRYEWRPPARRESSVR